MNKVRRVLYGAGRTAHDVKQPPSGGGSRAKSKRGGSVRRSSGGGHCRRRGCSAARRPFGGGGGRRGKCQRGWARMHSINGMAVWVMSMTGILSLPDPIATAHVPHTPTPSWWPGCQMKQA